MRRLVYQGCGFSNCHNLVCKKLAESCTCDRAKNVNYDDLFVAENLTDFDNVNHLLVPLLTW